VVAERRLDDAALLADLQLLDGVDELRIEALA